MASSHPIPQLAPGQVRKRNVFDILELFGGSTTTSSHKAKNILIRVDFNVPMNSEGKITDDSRIRGALPTIAAVLQAKHNCILMSHMGRPKAVQTGKDTDGAERAALSLNHVVDRLSELSGIPVQFVPDCIAPQVKDAASKLPTTGGAILLLENLRFYPQEEANDPVFAQALASIADAYVQDAFGTCHRAHASVSGVPALLPASKCGVGCLVASEVAYLDFTSLGPNDKVAAGKSIYIYIYSVLLG
jgi:phosphoglycerate kinase